MDLEFFSTFESVCYVRFFLPRYTCNFQYGGGAIKGMRETRWYSHHRSVNTETRSCSKDVFTADDKLQGWRSAPKVLHRPRETARYTIVQMVRWVALNEFPLQRFNENEAVPVGAKRAKL